MLVTELMKKTLRLVITGNPGVGKHTCAKLVARKLRGIEMIDINKMVIAKDAILAIDEKYGIDIDIKKASTLIGRIIETNRKGLIFVGHLAPYVINPAKISIAIVLRRSPYELVSVFEKRHYSSEKARENIASEILGISLYDSVKSFGKSKIAEVDVTRKTPSQTSDKIIAVLRKKSKPHVGFVDWLSLVHSNGDLQRFLEY
jgi:adenylate kinase